MEPEIPADPKPSTRKRMVIMIVAVGLLLGLLAGFNIFKNIMIGRALQGGQEPPRPSPPPRFIRSTGSRP